MQRSFLRNMFKIKLAKVSSSLTEEILSNCSEKWKDTEIFLRQLCSHSEIAAIARQDNGALIGFSLARKITINNCIAIAFLATRVVKHWRNKGIAKGLVKKIITSFIYKEKIINFLYWLKPLYFISIVANPVVFELLYKNLKIIPGLDSKNPNHSEINLAREFTKYFFPKNKFDPVTFVLAGVFYGSAEYYEKEEDIPWSNNEESNSFLENRINLRGKTGNGLVVVAKL